MLARCSGRSRWWFALVVFALVVAKAGPAVAQDVPPVPPHAPLVPPASPAAQDEPRQLVRDGNALFEAGKFKEALQLYEKAYALRQEPKWLFNMAQAHRELKNYGEAIRQYELFLAKIPDHPDKAEVEKLVDELKKKQSAAEEEARKKSVLPTGPLPTLGATPAVVDEPPRPWFKRWYVWAAVGAVVVAAAVIGGVVGSQNPNPSTPVTQFGNMRFFNAR
jgi:tetratricopeptide (TPR) repeat protein